MTTFNETDFRSVFMVPDNEEIPGRDDLNQVPLDEETKPDPEVSELARKHIKTKIRNEPYIGPEDAA